MLYYAKIENGIIKEYTKKEDVDSGNVKIDYSELIDYEPIFYKDKMYTQEKFTEIQNSQEYKDEMDSINQGSFEYEAKSLEEQSSYIEYKGKKFSLEEILFKSTIYNSVTDLYVYLKAEDKSLIKVLRATFLLIVAKAKSNLKDVQEALYNASYDKSKSLEENLNIIKNVFDSINKIFND